MEIVVEAPLHYMRFECVWHPQLSESDLLLPRSSICAKRLTSEEFWQLCRTESLRALQLLLSQKSRSKDRNLTVQRCFMFSRNNIKQGSVSKEHIPMLFQFYCKAAALKLNLEWSNLKSSAERNTEEQKSGLSAPPSGNCYSAVWLKSKAEKNDFILQNKDFLVTI